ASMRREHTSIEQRNSRSSSAVGTCVSDVRAFEKRATALMLLVSSVALRMSPVLSASYRLGMMLWMGIAGMPKTPSSTHLIVGSSEATMPAYSDSAERRSISRSNVRGASAGRYVSSLTAWAPTLSSVIKLRSAAMGLETSALVSLSSDATIGRVYNS